VYTVWSANAFQTGSVPPESVDSVGLVPVVVASLAAGTRSPLVSSLVNTAAYGKSRSFVAVATASAATSSSVSAAISARVAP